MTKQSNVETQKIVVYVGNWHAQNEGDELGYKKT
jgi:hypothetical protein